MLHRKSPPRVSLAEDGLYEVEVLSYLITDIVRGYPGSSQLPYDGIQHVDDHRVFGATWRFEMATM